MTIFIERTFNHPPVGLGTTSVYARDDPTKGLVVASVFDDMLKEFHSTLKGLNVSVMKDDATSTVSIEHSEDLSTTSFDDMANSCVSTERSSTEYRTDFDAIPSAAEFSGIHAAEPDLTVLDEFSETIASDFSDEDDVQFTFEPEPAIKINNEATFKMSTPTNRFEQLQEVDASEFEEFVPFLQDEQVAATLTKLAKCIRKKESLPEKIANIGNEISLSEFLSVAMLQNRDIYAAISDVLVRIGIKCKPPGTTNGSPIWKKVVFTFWPDEEVEAGELYATNQRRAVELLVEKAREQDATAHTPLPPKEAGTSTTNPALTSERTESRTPLSACDEAIVGPLKELGEQLKAQSDLLTKLTQAIQISVDKNETKEVSNKTTDKASVIAVNDPQLEQSKSVSVIAVNDPQLEQNNKPAAQTNTIDIHTKAVGQHAVAKGPPVNSNYIGDVRLRDPQFTNNPNFMRIRNAAAMALDESEAHGASADTPSPGTTNPVAGSVRFKSSEQDEVEEKDGTEGEDKNDRTYNYYNNNYNRQGRDDESKFNPSSEPRYNGDKDAKRVHDGMKTIREMFKDECFAGKPEDNWDKHRELYEEVAEPLGLTSKEKVQLFRHSLTGDALDFHRQSKGTKYKIWPKLVSVFEDKYASRIRKHENSKKLSNLEFKDHLKAKKGDHHAALDSLVRRIETLSQMAKMKDRSEEAKVEFLLQAVRKTPWFLQADARLLAVAESDLTTTVDEMHSAINAIKTHDPEALGCDGESDSDSKGILYIVSLSLSSESSLLYTIRMIRRKAIVIATRCPGCDSDLCLKDDNSVFFAGQKRYVRSHKGRKNHNKNSGGFDRRSRSNSDDRCFNCSKFNCRLSSCPEPKDQAKIEANLQAWRASRGINKPLHRVNFVKLNISPSQYAEILLAEELLEAAKGPATYNFFASDKPDKKDKSVYFAAGSTALEHAIDGSAHDIWFGEGDEYQPSTPESLKVADEGNATGFEENNWFEHTNTVFKRATESDTLRDKQIISPEEVYLIQARPMGKDSAPAHDILNASAESFDGICLDCGASLSVVGKQQFEMYCTMLGYLPEKFASESRFKFGESAFSALWKFKCRLGLPEQNFIEFEVHVVQGNFPLILGLEVMRQFGLITDWGRDTLSGTNKEWSLPIQYHSGHAFVHSYADTVLFTRAELEKLHYHFHHPSADKLFNLLKRYDPKEADASILTILREISAACHSCQEFSTGPLRFRASLPPDQLIFNQEVAVDLFWANKKPVIHFVDTHTNYQNAAFVESKTPEGLFKLFLNVWATVYLGYPAVLPRDRESSFNSKTFKELSSSQGIVLQFSGIESHNSIGKGERYHDPLRRIFNKVKSSYSTLDDETILRIAVKAANDTMGPNELVPTLLVYGSLPSLPVARSDNPTQNTRMKALSRARSEMETIVAEQRIRRALKSKLPPSTKYNINQGDEARVYREQYKKWIGPVKVVCVEGKIIHVTDGVKVQPFNKTQVMPATSHKRDREIRDALDKLFSLNEKIEKMYITEVLQNSDPRCKSVKAIEAVRNELEGLFKKNVFKIIAEEDIPIDAVVLPSRMVYAIKNIGSELEKFKARFTAGGHKDFWKRYLVHDSTNLKHHSVRTLVCVGTSKKWRIWPKDAKQAFVQEDIDRPVVLRPAPEFQLPLNSYLLVLKYLYGLADSGDAWYHKLRAKLLEVLQMLTLTGDASFYYRATEANELEGMMGTHVDDMLMTGSSEFEKNVCQLDEHIEMTPPDELPLTFAGIDIFEEQNGNTLIRKLNQATYIQKLDHLADNASFDEFRSMRHKLAWCTLTRPDISAAVALFSQVTESSFTLGHILRMNKTLGHLKSTASYCLRYSTMDFNKARIIVMSDGSHATNADSSSQLGYFMFLREDDNFACLMYKSYKSKRVVRSPLAAETIALADGADAAILMRQDLFELLGVILPIEILTDAQSLFDVISKGTTTSEKRLMIDIRATREAFEDETITFLGRIDRKYNIADPLTKFDSNAMMKTFMETGKIYYEVDQWIVRMNTETKNQSTA